MSDSIALLHWLATATIHASVLIALAWLVDAVARPRSLVLRETLWRLALVGGLCTASLQAVLGTEPAAGRVMLPILSNQAQAGSAMESRPTAADITVERLRTPAGHAVGGNDAAVVPSTGAISMRNAVLVEALRRVPRDWPSMLAAWWLLGLLFACARLVRGAWVLRRTIAGMAPVRDEQCRADAAALSRAARIAAPRLRSAERLAGPIAAPGGVICLPSWALSKLDRRQLGAMLAHEIAHLSRRDAWWQLLDALAHATLLFNPLAGLARRRLAAIAELSCDAWAAQATGDALALAECLAHCVERSLPHPDSHAAPAMAMATSTSPVLERVEHLLAENPMSNLSRKPLVRALALAGMIGAAFVLPAIGIAVPAPARAADGGKTVGNSIEIHDSIFGTRIKAHFKSATEDMRMEGDGEFAFNAAETDLASLEDGAELSIEQSIAGTTRKLEFEGEDGAIVRRYYVDGDEMPYDAAAQQWLAQAIPLVLRRTGIDAEARVGRILARGGVPAVLDEIDRIESDHVGRTYLSELSGQADPDAAQLDRALSQTERIDGDFDRREALTVLVAEPTLGPAQQVHALAAMQAMNSDFEQRSVFEALAPRLSDDAEVAAATRKALDTIESAFERREAIGYLAERRTLSAAQFEAVVAATRGIDSDFDRREALGVLSHHLREHPEAVPGFLASITGIDSDFDRREAIVNLVASTDLDVAGYAAAIDAADGIDSDFDCRESLVAIAASMPADTTLIERYRKAARGLSDHDRGQAEKALDRFATL